MTKFSFGSSIIGSLIHRPVFVLLAGGILTSLLYGESTKKPWENQKFLEIRACEASLKRESARYRSQQKTFVAEAGRLLTHKKFLKFAETHNVPFVDYEEYERMNPRTITIEEHISFIADILQVTPESLNIQFGFFRSPEELIFPHWMKLRVFIAEIERLTAEKNIKKYRRTFPDEGSVLNQRAEELNKLAQELFDAKIINGRLKNQIINKSELNEKMRLIRDPLWPRSIQIADLAMAKARTLMPTDSARLRMSTFGNEFVTEWWHIFNWHLPAPANLARPRDRSVYYTPSRSMHDGFVLAVQERIEQLKRQ